MSEKIFDDHIRLKSDILNALLPKFLKHLFWNFIFFLFLYGLYKLIDYSANLNFETEIILSLIFLTVLFSILKITKDLTFIYSTEFNFYSTHLEHKFKFIKEENHSISYSQITDVQVTKTLWDRICNVGDIHIHTGNDEYLAGNKNGLTLRDIKNPKNIREEIMKKVHR